MSFEPHISAVPQPGDLHVHTRLTGERCCVVTVAGELDLASAPFLKAAIVRVLEGRPACDVVLDCARLTHLDSTGLAVLIGIRRRLGGAGRIAIAAAPQQVQAVLALSGLETAFDAFGGVEDAIAYFAAPTRQSQEIPLSPDAALVLGLAGTAMPFAGSPAAEVECWLRVLLPYGASMLDVELPAAEAEASELADRQVRECDERRLDRVIAAAARLAQGRGAAAVRTGDVARAVAEVYGVLFEDALRSRSFAA